MAVLGFLDDMSYDRQSDEYAANKHINRALMRIAQDDFFTKLFEEKNIPYVGPMFDERIPVGGWFFKLGSLAGNLKDYVLGQLGLDSSLRIGLPEPYRDFTVSLGILARDFPLDIHPQEVDLHGGSEIDFATCLSAFQARRGAAYNQPYFLVMDKEFVKLACKDPDFKAIKGSKEFQSLINEFGGC
jgi:hypothetical protein